MNLGFSTTPGYLPWFSNPLIPERVERPEISVTIYSIFYDHMTVEWSIPSNWGNCTFNVYRAPSDSGPFEKINETPLIGNSFKDPDNKDVSKARSSYYKIEVRLPSGQYVSSKPITYINKRSNWVQIRADEIRRRELLLLRKFVGVRSLLFRRKTFGNRCSKCWDFTIEKIMKDHCTSCMGTGFEGGYFEGLELLVQYEQTLSQPVLGPGGLAEPNIIPAWTVNYPEIHSFDMLLRVPDWKMYRIEALQPTELQTVVVRQIMTLLELDKESIEYQLALQAVPESYR